MLKRMKDFTKKRLKKFHLQPYDENWKPIADMTILLFRFLEDTETANSKLPTYFIYYMYINNLSSFFRFCHFDFVVDVVVVDDDDLCG